MRLRLQARWRWLRMVCGFSPLLAVSILIAFAVLTHQRNEVWRRPVTLWEDAAHHSPLKMRPLINAGMSWREAGEPLKAADYYSRALQLNHVGAYEDRLHATAAVNLGYIHIERGEYQQAFDLVNGALQAAPTLDGMNAMALLLLISGEPREAVALTDEILREGGVAWRLRASLWATRGQAFQQLGDCNNAMAAYVAIKYLKPEFQIPSCP